MSANLKYILRVLNPDDEDGEPVDVSAATTIPVLDDSFTDRELNHVIKTIKKIFF